jgi:hypothetical protein
VKKIVLASAAMGGAALVAFGAAGTFAAYSDQQDVVSQEASAGTLLVEVGGNVSAPTQAQDLAPGDTAVFSYFVENAGKGVTGNLGGSIVDVVDYEDGCTDPERRAFDPCRNGEDAGELSGQVQATYYYIPTATTAQQCAAITEAPTSGGVPLGTLKNSKSAPAGPDSTELAPGAKACFLLGLTLEDRPDNNLVQSDNVSFTVRFDLVQYV